jgi:arabinofuranosyltransferase
MAHEAGAPADGARPVVPRMLSALLAVVFAGLLFKSAWISDDAAISLRTVLNFTHGFGLTFNIAERVQTFTHPLWLFLLTGGYLVVGNVFVAAMLVSIFISVAAFLVTVTRALTVWQAGVAAIVLFFSRAFVDFAASGLENPLFNFLIALFLWLFVGLQASDRRRLPGLWTIVSLLYLTRPDAVLLVLPLAVVAALHAKNGRRAAAALAMGSVPAVVWTTFATIYYGFPFPNTAYAKLATGVDGAELRQQGWLYLVDSLDRDPITLTTIGFAVVAGAVTRSVAARGLAAGIACYIGYIIWIGGDFMSGRFLTAPLFAAVLLCAWLVVASREVWLGAAGLLALVGSTAAHVPLWTHSGAVDPGAKPNGIVDERSVYFRDRSLVNGTRQRLRNPPWPTDTGTRPTMRVAETCGLMGQTGLDLGPYVHLLDECALADPLLARLPAVFNDAWRVGHYRRMVPAQYRESLERSANLLEDKSLAQYYDQLRLITRSPSLWSGERLRAIARMNRGAFDHLINQPYYRHAGSIVRLREVSLVKETGTPIDDQGVRKLDIALAIQCDDRPGHRQIDISVDSDDSYAIFFLEQGKLVGRLEIEPVPEHRRPSGLIRFPADLPPGAAERGFDTIVVSGAPGDDPPAIGHLILR